MDSLCAKCPHVKYCGLMISNMRLVKNGMCLIANSKANGAVQS